MSDRIRGSLRLFWIFLKIGAFTFGGGYAMIPVISRELVEKRRLVDEQDLLDVIAVAESTPGPIAVNAATFIGTKVAGFPGALAATVGVVLPAFVIMLIVSALYAAFRTLKPIAYAFMGIRAGVLALIVRAAYTMAKAATKSSADPGKIPGKSRKINVFSWILMAASFLAVAFFKQSALTVILGCALIGLASALIARAGHCARGRSGKGDAP